MEGAALLAGELGERLRALGMSAADWTPAAPWRRR